jgi:hypothetical protein
MCGRSGLVEFLRFVYESSPAPGRFCDLEHAEHSCSHVAGALGNERLRKLMPSRMFKTLRPFSSAEMNLAIVELMELPQSKRNAIDEDAIMRGELLR